MKNRFTKWLYIGSASDWSVVLFMLSAIVSCAKSFWELCSSQPVGSYPLAGDLNVILNVVIIVLFVISMGLAFLIDSVRETE